MCPIMSVHVGLDADGVPRYVRVTLDTGEVVEYALPLPGEIIGTSALFGQVVPLAKSTPYSFDGRPRRSVKKSGGQS